MGRLHGKVAMITGTSRGIGRAVALAFAAEGADLIIVGMTDEEALAGVEQEIAALGQRVIASLADVSHRTEIDILTQHIAEQWGRMSTFWSITRASSAPHCWKT